MLRECNKIVWEGLQIAGKLVPADGPLAESHRLLGTGGLVRDRKGPAGNRNLHRRFNRMKKKLLAVAVAGALAAPGLAMAQSSVTISGIWKASLENLRIGSPGAGRVGLNTSENRVADDSSRILFNVVEDLGGGLQAISQAALRMPMASGNVIAMSGNTHVGLRSASLGRIFVGRQDVHYGNTESDMSVLAGDLRADSVSILAYMANGVAVANATRTPNIIHYTTPNFGGFTAIVAYSTGPT